MTAMSKIQNINAASLAHIELAEAFIRLTQERLAVQHDPFVRESLGELLDSLRLERQGYAALLETLPMVAA